MKFLPLDVKKVYCYIEINRKFSTQFLYAFVESEESYNTIKTGGKYYGTDKIIR